MNSDKLAETLMGSTVREREKLIGVVEQQRHADELWSVQVDAVTAVEAVAKVDSGGGARTLRRRGEEEEDEEARGGEVKGTPSPIYKVEG